MKRILTVQDISCVGKCSLTVALPIISAFGVETAVLPTAVLSTHTQFKNFTFRDLTSDIIPIKNHWKNEGISFDSIYTGYLGSFEQLQIVSDLFSEYKNGYYGDNDKEKTIIVDPVMADNGKLYTGFTPEFASSMAKLCGKADIVVPNLTETSFMLNDKYVEYGYDEKYIKSRLDGLIQLGAKKAVITGVSFDSDKLGVYAFDKTKNEFFSYYNTKLPASFHGTGDIFASALTGAVALGYSLEKALKIAVDYTVECIRITLNNPSHRFYGVDFETAIPFLINQLQ